MQEPCTLCDGSGLRLVERPDGTRYAQECVCRRQRRAERHIAAARIPERYQHCTLEDYETQFPTADRTLGGALMQARNFVRAYPVETDSQGLLFTGSIGTGKTHLAVGILQTLVRERGVRGLFVDYRDLLKQVQNSWNASVGHTELDILRPVFEAEVLVLDELGASKPSEWVWDTVAHILNTRYNDRRTTIITTNYPNLAPGGAAGNSAFAAAKASAGEDSLGDRIGERMRSRLQEMCVAVELRGADFRQGVKRARFG
jgi:DNA replication protein DnaC